MLTRLPFMADRKCATCGYPFKGARSRTQHYNYNPQCLFKVVPPPPAPKPATADPTGKDDTKLRTCDDHLSHVELTDKPTGGNNHNSLPSDMGDEDLATSGRKSASNPGPTTRLSATCLPRRESSGNRKELQEERIRPK